MAKRNKDRIGKTAHVIVGSIDAWGKVTSIDINGKYHGTWGPEAVDPKSDYISFTD